jgi:hypothetical protein
MQTKKISGTESVAAASGISCTVVQPLYIIRIVVVIVKTPNAAKTSMFPSPRKPLIKTPIPKGSNEEPAIKMSPWMLPFPLKIILTIAQPEVVLISGISPSIIRRTDICIAGILIND